MEKFLIFGDFDAPEPAKEARDHDFAKPEESEPGFDEVLLDDDPDLAEGSMLGTPHAIDRDTEITAPRAISLATLVRADPLCVTADTPVAELRELLLERGLSGAPVVDENQRPVGMVTMTDLVRNQPIDSTWSEAPRLMARTEDGFEYPLDWGFQLEPLRPSTVADVMTPFVFALPLHTPIVQAAALMAYEQVHRVVLLDAAGFVMGMVTTLDVTAWMTTQAILITDDFVPTDPDPPRPPQPRHRRGLRRGRPRGSRRGGLAS